MWTRLHERTFRDLCFLAVTAVFLASAAAVALAQDEDDDDESMILDSFEFEAFDGFEMGASAEFSVTAGGAQDIGLARTQIENGLIPGALAFLPEGLLSEHDLPVEGPPCLETFCPRTSAGYAPAFDTGKMELWVQLGFGSALDPTTFTRRPLNLAIVLDRSGSMSGVNKLEYAREAALALVGELGESDYLALISFDSEARLDVPSQAVTDPEVFTSVIEGWQTDSSTNLEAALALGYQQMARHASDDMENRVIVITDMLPNVGMTGPESFAGMANRWAEEGLNMTVIGVGTDFGQELGVTLSELRGGNYFFLRSSEDAQRVLGDELTFTVTPVAFDVDMEVEVQPGFELTAVYGLPTPEEGVIETHIETLFLSNKGGAIVLRFAPSDNAIASWADDTTICDITLRYTNADGSRQTSSTTAAFDLTSAALEGATFEQSGPYRAWALVQQALTMREALEVRGRGDAAVAQSMLEELAGVLREVADETNDDSLEDEAELVEALAALL